MHAYNYTWHYHSSFSVKYKITLSIFTRVVSRDTFPVWASTFTAFSTDNPVDSFILDLYFYKRTTKWIVDSNNYDFVSFVKCIWIVFIKTNVSVVLDNFTKT